MRARQENLIIARWLAEKAAMQSKTAKGNRRGPYRLKNGLNDIEIVAQIYGVTVLDVKRVLHRRDLYPNNRIIQHYDSLQELKQLHTAKESTLRKMVA